MNDNVFALIVGIEKYDQDPTWEIVGPCANALGIVDWLLSINVPPANIFVFLHPAQDLKARVMQLQQAGVPITLDATWNTIDTFWRDKLLRGRAGGSRLMVYWSGHGYAANDGTRIFLCRDFTATRLTNRVFNGTSFLRHLRGSAYQAYADQIFLADVCATHMDLKLDTQASDPGKPVPTTKQTAYYATPEGVYAKGAGDRGVFTNIVLSVLGELDRWPDHNAFSAAMEDGFRNVKQSPFRVYYALDGQGESDKLVGPVPLDPGSSLFNSVYSLLSAIDIPDGVFLPHYARTVTSLGTPELARAEGLSGMVRQLASLRDAPTPQQVPYGMIEFLSRLAQEGALRVPIEKWLAENVGLQRNDLANARETIGTEKTTKILLIEVMNDNNGEIAAFEVFVRTSDLRPVPGVTFPPEQVRTWSEFRTKLLAVIAELQTTHFIEDFQIQFAVAAPLFDQLFHAIEIGDGRTLGEQYVVVMRYGPRLRWRRASLRGPWLDYANALRFRRPADVTLLPVPSEAGKGILPSEKGFCYFNVILSPASDATADSIRGKQILQRLLDLGVPYLYWLHQLPYAHEWKQVEMSFTTWLGELTSLDEFPDAFRQHRLSQDPLAADASLLWDDPRFNPLYMNSGVNLE